MRETKYLSKHEHKMSSFFPSTVQEELTVAHGSRSPRKIYTEAKNCDPYQ